jgi:hypothetical protein
MAMPLDRRLRSAFDRAASIIEPDVERYLQQTTRLGARRRAELPLGTLLAASAVVVALLVVTGIPGTPSEGAGGPSPTGVGSSSSPSGDLGPVVGTYTVSIQASDPGAATEGLDLAGTWSMTLLGSGVMDVLPPETFEGSRATGHTFSIDGETFLTDLYYNDYCNSVGMYGWERIGDTLALTVVDDACGLRRTLLGTRAWSTTP